MATDLELAYQALSGKLAGYTQLWDYYRGNAPVVYTNERLREVFRNLDAKFTENWCGVVVNAAASRINLSGATAPAGQQGLLDNLWSSEQVGIVADDVHEAALVFGEAFVIAWLNADGSLGVYYNDPRLVHAFYDEENPHVMRFAAKWYNRDGFRRMTLYYPERIEYYQSRSKAEEVSSAGAFQPDAETPVATNQFGQIPVFHFRTHNDMRSELEPVIPVQNGINKLLVDMIVAAEYGALKQRWIISNTEPGALKNAPNEVWWLPAGDGAGQATQVGQFEPSDLQVYMSTIDGLINHLSAITCTPRHFFVSQGAPPSGESLIVMEAPLNKKCEDYIMRFSPTWQALLAFALRLVGQAVDPQEISPTWEDVQSVQPLTRAAVRKSTVDAGIPLVTALRNEGWSEAELAQMEKDQKEQAGKQQASLASALVQAQRQMDQGQMNQGQMNQGIE